MALYEVLIRGNPDGTIKGASIEEWVAAGTNADGSFRYVPGDPRPATAEEISAFVGAQYAQAAAQVASLTTERDALVTERDSLKSERDALKPIADTVPALTTERTALQTERDSLKTERDGLQAQTSTLKDQVITLKGVPAFLASALLALFTADDMTSIASALAVSDARALYFELQQRAVTGDKPIPINSQKFLAGLAVLRTALGEERVAALFAALNIDLTTGRYINP